jgi:mRNA-degrading endonuclease RelE of RelBE toxin-antitoxin system
MISGDRSNWNVVYKNRVRRQLAELPDQVFQEARDSINGLTEDPLPFNAKRLRKNRNTYSIRLWYGPHPSRKRYTLLYRLIYRVFESSRTVEILRIAKRDEATYSGFDRW